MSTLPFERTPAYSKIVWRRRFYLFLAVALDLAALFILACVHIYSSPPEQAAKEILGFYVSFELFHWQSAVWMSLLVAGQIFLGHRAMVHSYNDPGNIELYPVDRSNGQRFGELTGPEIVAIVHELAEKLGVRQPTHIILHTEPIPNAYTGSLIGYGTVVVLHSNLLEILPRNEVRAIIAHELGHVRRWDSFINQLANVPRSFQFFVRIVLLFKVIGGLTRPSGVAEFFARLLFLYLGWQLLNLVFGSLERIGNLAMQQCELLADGYSAQACGPEPIINGLLRIGERAEALNVLAERLVPWHLRLERQPTQEDLLRLLQRFPPGEMRARVAQEMAPALIVRDQLLLLKEKMQLPLSEEQIDKLAEEAGQALKAEEASKPAEERIPEPAAVEEDRLLDWHKFDFDHSGALDREELTKLVADLRQKPNRMIFRQFLAPDSEWESHPTIRHRLLFLYETFIEGAAKSTT
jgi:Zn-dependent protease with chaperone function